MDVVFANTTTHVTAATGHTVLVILGTHWPANDPIVLAFPQLFSDDPTNGLYYSQPPIAEPATLAPPPQKSNFPPTPPVETATTGPGEKRGLPRVQ